MFIVQNDSKILLLQDNLCAVRCTMFYNQIKFESIKRFTSIVFTCIVIKYIFQYL